MRVPLETVQRSTLTFYVSRFTACKPSKDFRRLDLDLLRDHRQGHRLIVQVTVACGVGGDFAVRIEADLLGLLRQTRYDDAERVYREALDYHPHNGWSLFGLRKALGAQGKSSPDVDADFDASWARSDTWIRASRF